MISWFSIRLEKNFGCIGRKNLVLYLKKYSTGKTVTRNNEDRRFVKDRRKISCSLKTAIIIKIRRKCEYCVALCRSNFTNFILQILRILQHIFLFRIGYLKSRLTIYIIVEIFWSKLLLFLKMFDWCVVHWSVPTCRRNFKGKGIEKNAGNLETLNWC